MPMNNAIERDGEFFFEPDTGKMLGYRNPVTQNPEPAVTVSDNAGALLAGDFVFALAEQAPVQTLTATGTALTGAGEYGGFRVRAIVGGPQTVTVYDATSATGTPIHTEVVSAVGFFPWAGNRLRVLNAGCHVTISGGTSRTLDVLAG